MNATEILHRTVRAFERHNVPYMVVGSLSVNVYAEPRSTHDADFVVQLDRCPIERIAEMLGPDFTLERQMSFESITMTTRYRLSNDASLFSIEVFDLTLDPFDQQRFQRRRASLVGGRDVIVPTVEDVIIQKLRWSARGKRPKDVGDARNVIVTNASDIDVTYIRDWCGRLGVLSLFDELYAQASRDAL